MKNRAVLTFCQRLSLPATPELMKQGIRVMREYHGKTSAPGAGSPARKAWQFGKGTHNPDFVRKPARRCAG